MFLSLITYHFTSIICQWSPWVLGNSCLCHQWWYLATFSSVGLCIDCLPFFQAIRFPSVTLAFTLCPKYPNSSFIISACNKEAIFTSSSIELFVFLEVQDLFNTLFQLHNSKALFFFVQTSCWSINYSHMLLLGGENHGPDNIHMHFIILSISVKVFLSSSRHFPFS